MAALIVAIVSVLVLVFSLVTALVIGRGMKDN